MIFVTAGATTYPFDRLIKKMDEISATSDEKIVMQIGVTTYEPKNTEWFRFETEERMNYLYDTCSLIVCHGGAGTMLNAFSRGKMLVMVPRKKKFNEAVDDHQMDLTKKVADAGKGLWVDDIDDLPGVLEKARNVLPASSRADSSLETYLSNLFERMSEKKSKK